ncbi:MAG: hypothetical protein HY381_02815 [Candidatus Chisholmbacteria bacterium]|nr:hypothetical protein [Candidatus Chisholmbacteria bacterium]
MAVLLTLLLLSFVITSILIIPFINLLYQLKFRRPHQTTKDVLGHLTPIFNILHAGKVGTPIGGGLLIIILVSLLFAIFLPLLRFLGFPVTHVYSITDEINVIFFTFLSFGLLGLYDDIRKFFNGKAGEFGLPLRYKFILQWVLATLSALLLFVNLKIDLVNVPFIGAFHLGWLYIPAAAFVIVSFTNAFNITDGLDGLATGLLMIALFAFWFLSASILDTPLSIFLALWLGSIIAFLYFNVYPARIFLGDVGSLSFGATLAVVGLLLGKIIALVLIGGLFALEIFTSLLQILSKKFWGKKLFPAAPLHLWLQQLGWEEPKIVMRAWLAAIILALFGVWLAVI